MRFLAGIAGLAFLAMVAGGAQAAERLYTTISGAELQTILKRLKVEATVDATEWGEPLVYGTYGPLRFQVMSYGCQGNPGRCQRIDFSAGFNVKDLTPDKLEEANETLASLNDFNKKLVFGKAYLADDGTVRVDMPVNLNGGITERNLEDNIGLWLDTLRTFAQSMGWFEGS